MKELSKIWQSVGINKDDTILIQSNVVHLIRGYRCSVKDILESFLEVAGTCVFPVFNTDFNDGIPFDFNKTPSKMGVLSEMARTYPSAVRSGHPSYGFVAIGKLAHLFNVNNFSGYGKDSPFAILRRLNGKVGVLGLVNNEGNTMFHHVEEMHQVSYRFYKLFRGQYTDKHGQTSERIYAFYCNKGVKTLLNPIDDLLWEKKLYRGDKPYEGDGFRVIDANKMFDFVWKIIESGKAEGLLYEKIK